MLAFSAQLDGTELVFFNAANDASTVSLFMQDSTGSSFYYSIDGGPLTPAPTPFGTGPQTGITAIRVLDSVTDGSGSGGDSLELYGFGGATIDVSGKNILFGGTTPITTLNVENFLIDGLESRSPVNLDGVSVTNDLSIRNASVATIATTSRLEVGRNLSIDTNTLQLPGAMSVGGTASLVLAGGVLQAANAPITASTLTVVNSVSGDVLLTNSDNAVDFLSIRNLADSGAVAFTDADGLTVGVAGVGIVANNDAVTISSGGRLTLAQNIEAGDGTVYLIAANGIGQASTAGVIARSLTFRNGSAPVNPSLDVTLLGSLNGVDILAGVNFSFDGDVSFANSKGLSIGTGADGISGLTNFAGVVSVTAGGQLSIDDEVLANNSGKVVLAARNGVQQSGAGRIVGRDVDVSNTISGAISLGLAANDADYLTITNKTPDGTVVYSDDTGFTVGIGGISTTTNSGAVALTAKGTIDQVGSIMTRTLTVSNLDTAAGNLSLGLTTNDVQFLNLANANATGAVSYGDTSGFEVGDLGIDAAGNAVSITAGGAVSQSGDVVVSSLAITQTGAGGVAFTRSTNSIPTVTGSIGTGTLAVTTQTDLVVGSAGISASKADVRLTADGSITQTGSITAQSLHAENTSAATGDILLVNPLNDIASFTATNPNADGSVTVATAGSMAVGAAGVNAAGDITIFVAGSLNDTGTIDLVGAINTTGGDLTITAVQGSLAFSPTDRQITVAVGALTLRSLAGQLLSAPILIASQDVTITGYQTVTLTEQITSRDGNVTIGSLTGDLALGADTFVITADAGSVSLYAGCGTITVQQICAADAVLIEGELGVTTEGNIDGLTVTLLAECGPVSVLDICAEEDVSIRSRDSIAVSRTILSDSGSVSASSSAGPITVNQIQAGTGITLEADLALTILSSIVSDTGNITVTSENGQVLAAAGTLIHALLGNVSATSVTGPVTVGQLQAGEDITLSADQLLTVLGSLTATAGDLTLTSTNANVNLSAAAALLNAVAGAVSVTSATGSVSVRQIEAGNGVTLSADQALTVIGSVLANAGNITLSSTNQDIDLSAATALLHAVAGQVNATAPFGNADIRKAGAFDDIVVTTGGDIRVTDQAFSNSGSIVVTSTAGEADLRNLSAKDAIRVTSYGIISLSGDITTFEGNVKVQSIASGVNLSANIDSAGSFDLLVNAGIRQQNFSGITAVQVLSSGSGYTPGATVTIAAPANGGVAATAVPIVSFGEIQSIVITNPGSGYSLGEAPAVTITGTIGGNPLNPTPQGVGAAAKAIGPTTSQNITAKADITLVAQEGVVLESTVSTSSGDITVTSATGSLDLGSGALFLNAGGDVLLEATRGTASLQRISAVQGVTVKAEQGISLAGKISAEQSDVLLYSQLGNLTSTPNTAEIVSLAGKVTLKSAIGDVLSTPATYASGDVLVSGWGQVSLANGLTSENGKLEAISLAGSVQLAAALNAKTTILLDAFGSVSQQSSTGISAIRILSPGEGYTAGATVTIAAPAKGGTAATAVAAITDGTITSIIITNSGSGYAVGESPEVTITGGVDAAGRPIGVGAAAQATGPAAGQDVVAGEGILIRSAGDIRLAGAFRADSGNVEVTSKSGDLDLANNSTFLHAIAGRVQLTASAGNVAAQRLLADNDAIITANKNASVLGGIESRTGSIDVSSVLAGATAANLLATQGSISITALDAIALTGSLRAADAVDVKSSAGSVSLAAAISSTSNSVNISAGTLVTQRNATGITEIQVLGQGSGYSDGATVTIAPPANGGQAAEATAIVGRRDEDVAGRVVTIFFIREIFVTNPGSGYAIGESPSVTITGVNGEGSGAGARAVGPAGLQNLTGLTNVTIAAGNTITLANTITATTGDIFLRSAEGSLVLDDGTLLLHAQQGNVELVADLGAVSVNRIVAGDSVSVQANQTVTATGTVESAGGSVTVKSSAGGVTLANVLTVDDITADALGNIAFDPISKVAAGGNIFLQSRGGTLSTPASLTAGGSIDLQSFGVISITGDVRAAEDISGKNRSGGVLLAANVVAEQGSVNLNAQSTITQQFVSGISGVRLLAAGSVVNGSATQPAPTVTVAIAAPARGGGVAATAVAILGSREIAAGFGNIDFEYFIQSIVITNPGRGYAVGESPIVTITGMNGASAIASGPTGLQSVTAGEGLALEAGDAITLVSTWTANTGDAVLESVNGNIELGASTAIINAKQGRILIDSGTGAASLNTLDAKDDISVEVQGTVTLSAGGRLASSSGGVDLTSRAGNLDLGGGDSLVLAGDSISLAASAGTISTPAVLNASKNIDLQGYGPIKANGSISSLTGDVDIRNVSGGIGIEATITAPAGSITIDAQSTVTQQFASGISAIQILSPGVQVNEEAFDPPPTVTVSIAPPASGGSAAQAVAILGRRSVSVSEGRADFFEYFINSIVIVNAGSGYALGESPAVTITGITGAAARAFGPTGLQSITAGEGISISADDTITLSSTLATKQADITVISRTGDLELSASTLLVDADAGRVELRADRGTAAIQRAFAADDLEITALQGITIFEEAKSETGSVRMSAAAGGALIRDVFAERAVSIEAEGTVQLLGAITTFSGDVSLTSLNRDLDFTAADALIFADLGGVSLTSLNGSILSPPVLNVGGDVFISSFNTVQLHNEVTSVSGAIDVTSTSGGIALSANLVAHDNAISLNAKSEVTQLGRGIASVKVLEGGQNYTASTRVRLAAPTAGGVTATARPVIGRVNGVPGVLMGIQIINPGSGYGVGEEVEVTITGAGTGASAVAYASSVLQNITADSDVTIVAGAGITLLNTVSSLTGDIAIRANVGDIDLSTETVRLSANKGGVEISTFSGSILSPPVLNVADSITLQSYAALSLANAMTAGSGDITLRSTSGAVNLGNNLFAGDRITLDANAGILQTKGYVQAQELVVANKSALPVVLGAQENNIDRFAGTSVGGITYIDADSFETGVLRGNKLGDQRIEVSTNGALTLQAGTSSSGPLRIVGGVSAAPNQLFLSSGSAAIPGEVEYVVTNSQSAGQSTFTGSLANMVRLANLNKARFDDQVVPQTIVFDADGYAVETITVTAAIPIITQPVTIDGSATEATVTNDRVEVRSGSSGVLNGLMFGTGSAGSEVTGLSVTGFSRGAGIALMSSNATVTDTLVGVHRDGTVSKASRNLVGIDIGGTSATSNTIGGSVDGDANVIGGNGIGVRIRGRASGNVVSGNFVGTDAEEAVRGNSIGVQIVGSSSNLVSENLISNNTDGIQLNTATATAATANRIELNTIVGNSAGAGLRVSASSFALVGGADVGNVIGNNGAGIVITGGSTSNVVAGNYIGTNADGELLGNKTDGVQVFASIGNTIGGTTEDARNFVANNGGSGIVIRNSVASSAAGGNRVFLNTSSNNAKHGILVEGSSFHTIGNGADTGNTITLNDGDGIRVQSFGKTSSSRNLIRGNLVGTDSRIADIDLGNTGDGIAIIGGSANRLDLGNVVRFNAANGVRVEGSSSNFIGSDVVDEGNVIRDNLANGVVITGGATNLLARDNVVAGNIIDRNGTAPGSATSGNGVLVSGNRTVNTAIGTRIVNGRLLGQGNDISDNEGYGVSVVAGASNVQIQGNAIAENNLGPVNIATGANANVATPVITSATLEYLTGTAAQLVVKGTVTGPLTQQLAIDIYCTPAENVTPGKPDYGRRHIGRVTVTITDTKVTGTSFTARLAIQEAATGDLITATATTMSAVSGQSMVATPIGSTSRFSAERVILVLPSTVSSTSPSRQVRRV